VIQQVVEGGMKPKWLVAGVDFVLINIIYYIGASMGALPFTRYGFLFAWFAYIISILLVAPVAHNRMATVDKMANRVFRTVAVMIIVFAAAVSVTKNMHFNILALVICAIVLFVVLLLGRLLSRKILKCLRSIGMNNRRILFVGAGANLRELYSKFSFDLAAGYQVLGYFDGKVSESIGDKLPLLGDVKEVVGWLEHNRVDMLFCNLPHERSTEILEIMNYCENHLIRFYSVPNVKNYVHRAMEVEFVDDFPVLSLRREPLMDLVSRVEKRIFDILFSLFVIVGFLWWITIIVAIITKITMPGPVFFRQKRNGLYGKEFWCLKFRSMKVNDDADKVQATKDDPRKTKWGDIMRKTNIDELPQFFNVLLGDMSIVGPRPHMVKHTEEYGALINKYMVRHYAKPGITGWAQVTGSRGETSELWMMEERIKKDIWYIENWSFWLDIRIIYLTIRNVLGGEEGNAY